MLLASTVLRYKCSCQLYDTPIDPQKRWIMGRSCPTIRMSHGTIKEGKGTSQNWPICVSWSIKVPWVWHFMEWCITISNHMCVKMGKMVSHFFDRGCVIVHKRITHVWTMKPIPRVIMCVIQLTVIIHKRPMKLWKTQRKLKDKLSLKW